MSRIGNAPITIPSGVEITIQDGMITVKGSKGTLTQAFESVYVEIKIDGETATVTRKNESKEAKSRHGLYRSLLANMIQGVTEGFIKSLEIRGVGYRGSVSGNRVELNLGYSHPVHYQIPEGVSVEFDKENNNILHVSGIDKQLVGQVSSNIRSFRKPEPYKGKGIRYVDEYVAMKAGKSAAKAAA